MRTARALAMGGVPARGVYLPGVPPPWTEFLTHASENITLPDSLAGGSYVVDSICGGYSG